MMPDELHEDRMRLHLWTVYCVITSFAILGHRYGDFGDTFFFSTFVYVTVKE